MTTTPLRGERLTALRRLHGLSQTRLATELGVTQSFLSLVERSERTFPETLAGVACSQFALPRSFFAVPARASDLSPVTFRKKASAGARAEARVVQAYREAARLFELVSERSGYGSAHLPDPQAFESDPAKCAEAIRDQLGLDWAAPVPNVTRALERLGIGVLDRLDPHPAQRGDHLSVSRPADATARPLVAIIADGLPGAVQRLSLAHELGHLLLDRDRIQPIAGTRSKEERRAYSFASALLVPDQVLRDAVSETLTLNGYLRIKADYGISVAALIIRARDLDIISRTRARSLQIQLSSQGWRAHEPVEVASERSLLFEQAYRRVFGDRSASAVAYETGHSPELLTYWLGEPTTPIPDGHSAHVVDLAERRNRTVKSRRAGSSSLTS